MLKSEIYITKSDQEKLLNILSRARSLSPEDQRLLKKLEEEVARAQVIESAEIPSDVVSMNSQVCIQDLDTGVESIYTVVFPGYSNFYKGRVSVLAPMGTAILGYRVGDVIEWKMPRGMRRFKIIKILYQPEADDKDFS